MTADGILTVHPIEIFYAREQQKSRQESSVVRYSVPRLAALPFRRHPATGGGSRSKHPSKLVPSIAAGLFPLAWRCRE